MPLENTENNITAGQIMEEYKEAVEIFPALRKYKNEHNATNLQKLCVEVAAFCKAIYASTQNESERAIYNSMIKKLNK